VVLRRDLPAPIRDLRPTFAERWRRRLNTACPSPRLFVHLDGFEGPAV
jgi:hypothetical protein